MHQQRKKKKKRGRKKRIIIIIILTAVHIFPAVVGLHTRAECVSGEAAGMEGVAWREALEWCAMRRRGVQWETPPHAAMLLAEGERGAHSQRGGRVCQPGCLVQQRRWCWVCSRACAESPASAGCLAVLSSPQSLFPSPPPPPLLLLPVPSSFPSHSFFAAPLSLLLSPCSASTVAAGADG